MFKVVKPMDVRIVLRFGRAVRVMREGLNMKRPFIESTVAQTLSLKNLDVQVDGITNDNVKTSIGLNVVFNVKHDDKSIIDSVFKVKNPVSLITAMIEEQLRAKLFTFSHEEIFSKREEIGAEVKETLKTKLEEFGMMLDSVQVKDIKLDAKVMDAMNGVVASEKIKLTAIKQAEGEKASLILKAEADKQVKKLLGEGMAEQRRAIAEGFKKSIEDIKGADDGLKGAQILEFLLASSRIETLEKIGEKNSKVIYVNENLEGKIGSMIGVSNHTFKDEIN